MRKNEKARLARRDEYRKNKAIVGKTALGKPFTQKHAEEFENASKIALHESSHVVAAWMLGMQINGLQFNDSAVETEITELAAQSSVGIPVPEMVALTMGERYVFALQHAFVTLAGVLGSSGEASNLANPLFEFETKSHVQDAISKLERIAGMSRSCAKKEVKRLIPHVTRTFDDKRVQFVTKVLADNLLRLRVIAGEQAAAILSQAWPVIDVAYRQSEGLAD